MKAKSIGIGIIGYGSITPFHIHSLLELDDCRLIAIQSSNEEKRQMIREKYEIITLKTYKELIKLDDIDLIIICTPSGFHLEPALEALRAGKHVVVEKPLEINTARCNQMIRASKKSGVSLSCIFQNRFSENFLKIKNAIDSGKLGKLLLGNAYIKWKRDQAYYDMSPWRGTLKGDGGAVLINQGIHTIDLLIQLMGQVNSVSGSVRTLTHAIEGEDVATANLEFQNGALGTIEASTSLFHAFPEKIEIHGEKGSIILEGGEITHWNTREDGNLDLGINKSNTGSGANDPMAIDYNLHKNQLSTIIKAIKLGKKPPVNAQDALRAVQIIEAIYKSSDTDKKIKINV